MKGQAMTDKKSTTKGGRKGKADDNKKELDDFAHHLAEVLRIARTNPLIPSRLYNGISEAWTAAQTNTVTFYESPEFIRLMVSRMKERGAE
jgi:hypothetical protein